LRPIVLHVPAERPAHRHLRPGKVSFLRPCSVSPLASLTITTVSAMWVEFPQDHDHGPVTAHRLAAYPNDSTMNVLCRRASRHDIAPNVDPTWAQHLVRLGIAG